MKIVIVTEMAVANNEAQAAIDKAVASCALSPGLISLTVLKTTKAEQVMATVGFQKGLVDEQ